MSTESQRPFDYVPIVGAGVDAHERRDEYNSDPRVTTAELRASIAKVRPSVFRSMKMLVANTAKRVTAK